MWRAVSENMMKIVAMMPMNPITQMTVIATGRARAAGASSPT